MLLDGERVSEGWWGVYLVRSLLGSSLETLCHRTAPAIE